MTRKDKHGLWILSFVAAFFLGMLVWLYCLKVSADNIDPETLCRVGKQDPVVKLLIDKTDPWDEHTRQRLVAAILRIKSGLAVHERLSIFVLDETGTYSPSPLFDMCNPGRGDQANDLYQNPRRMQMKFNEQFAGPLDALMETLQRPGVASSSPIIEALHGLRSDNSQERLIIVSDMMQNSSNLSFYGRKQDMHYTRENDICRLETPYTSIHVYFVNRRNISVSQKQQVRIFWDQCLDRAAWATRWDVL